MLSYFALNNLSVSNICTIYITMVLVYQLHVNERKIVDYEKFKNVQKREAFS